MAILDEYTFLGRSSNAYSALGQQVSWSRNNEVAVGIYWETCVSFNNEGPVGQVFLSVTRLNVPLQRNNVGVVDMYVGKDNVGYMRHVCVVILALYCATSPFVHYWHQRSWD